MGLQHTQPLCEGFFLMPDGSLTGALEDISAKRKETFSPKSIFFLS